MGIVASTGFKTLDDQIDDCVKQNKNECKKNILITIGIINVKKSVKTN